MFNLYAHHQPLGRFWLFLLFVWSTLSFDFANSKASIFSIRLSKTLGF